MDFSGGQLGDVQIGQAASQIHHGASADRLLEMWYEWQVNDRHYRNLDTTEREQRREALDSVLQRIQLELFILRIVLAALALLVLLVLVTITY